MRISKHDLWQSAKVLILALVLSVGVSYALAWTGPTASPPGNNTPTPVNVSATDQTKQGQLWSNVQLGSWGSIYAYNFVQANEVCIGRSPGSDCRTAWPGGGVTNIVAGSNITISPTSGTGAVTISSTAAMPSGSLVGACLNGGSDASNTWVCWGGASGTNFNNSNACPSGSTKYASPAFNSLDFYCVKN